MKTRILILTVTLIVAISTIHSSSPKLGELESSASTTRIVIQLNRGMEVTNEQLVNDYPILVVEDARSRLQADLRTIESPFGVEVRSQDCEAILARLNADPRVDYAEIRQEIPVVPLELSRINPRLASVSDSQWGLAAMEVPANLVSTARIGVVDTGCDPALANTIAGGWDFFRNIPDYSDTHPHGKYIAALIASEWGALASAQIYALKCSN